VKAILFFFPRLLDFPLSFGKDSGVLRTLFPPRVTPIFFQIGEFVYDQRLLLDALSSFRKFPYVIRTGGILSLGGK